MINDILALECRRGNLRMVKCLVKSGKNVNSINIDTDPLWCAVMAGHYDVIEYLLSSGSKITKDRFGQTCMDVALREENFEIANLFSKYT